MLNRIVSALVRSTRARFFFAASLFGLAASVQAVEFSEANYEVYYGDFNGDGKAGDVYYHRKDTFVLIHGDIAIPLQIANDGSYVVYEGTETPVSLKLATGALGSYTKGTLNDDYYFTDVDNDGDIDIVATAISGATRSTTLAYGSSAPQVTVSETRPEYIPVPTQPSIANKGLVTGAEIQSIDALQTLGGSFRVDESGAATYSIPIAVPAGTAGVAPEIGLNYSSAAGNGVAGLGWSVSGVGSISRCRSTKSQDGVSSPISLTGGNKLCLNGQRLIMMSGYDYGYSGSTYRTEIDSGVIVTITSSFYNIPKSFEVRGKDGSVAIYGGAGNDNSAVTGYINGVEAYAIESQGVYASLSWKIKEFRDSVGNKITYTYDKSSAGHYIKSIEYAYGGGETAHAKVEFDYTDGRPDPSYTYVAGYEFNVTKLLDKITTSSTVAGVYQEAYSYQLKYYDNIEGGADDFVNDTLSRVESIRLCGSGVCSSEPTRFAWGSDQISFGSVRSFGLTSSQSGTILDVKTPDIDGDGRLDLVWSLVNYSGGSYHYYVYYKQIDSSARQMASYSLSTFENKPLNIIDYNGDGRGDIAYRGKVYEAVPPDSSANWYYSPLSDVYTDDDKTMFADINADGLSDLMLLNGKTVKVRQLERDVNEGVTSRHFYKFGDQSIFSMKAGSCGVFGSGWYFKDDNLSFGDFNGDGQMDIVAYFVQDLGQTGTFGTPGGIMEIHSVKEYAAVFNRSGNSFLCSGKALLKNGDHYGEVDNYSGRWKIKSSADVNSDGLSDLVISDSTGYT